MCTRYSVHSCYTETTCRYGTYSKPTTARWRCSLHITAHTRTVLYCTCTALHCTLVLHTAICYTLHTAHTAHTVHCILHTAHCTLHAYTAHLMFIPFQWVVDGLGSQRIDQACFSVSNHCSLIPSPFESNSLPRPLQLPLSSHSLRLSHSPTLPMASFEFVQKLLCS
jgi:hypothetical protein